LKEVLHSFIESTQQNTVLLERAIVDNNSPEIKSIAHRITPMFKQIEAQEISIILKKLEDHNFENDDLKSLFEDLKEKINLLFRALQQKNL